MLFDHYNEQCSNHPNQGSCLPACKDLASRHPSAFLLPQSSSQPFCLLSSWDARLQAAVPFTCSDCLWAALLASPLFHALQVLGFRRLLQSMHSSPGSQDITFSSFIKALCLLFSASLPASLGGDFGQGYVGLHQCFPCGHKNQSTLQKELMQHRT